MYRIDCRLASGGMGSIYLARRRDDRLGHAVAVKCIHAHLAENPAFHAMFMDEARITSQIAHPSVCKVLEYGVEGRQPYLAMEFIVGENLAAIVRAAARFTQDADAPNPSDKCTFETFVLGVVAAICDGLHAAHELCDEQGRSLGVVHRDVSPANLFVTYDGGVRVVDFGVAKAAGRAHETVSGVVKGKFAYMSPEQMAGADVDRRTDIWSIGVVMFELLTGRRLFRRQSEAATVHAVLHEGVPHLDVIAPGRSPELAAIVARCLSADPVGRYVSAAALANDLRAYLVKHGQHANEADLGAWMHQLFPAGLARKHELLARARALGARRTSRGRGPLAALALLVLAVAGLLLSPLLRPQKTHEAAPVERSASGPGLTSAATPASASAHSASGAAELASGAALARPSPASEHPAPGARVSPEPQAKSAAAVNSNPSRVQERGLGVVNIATPGGWAELFLRGKRLGTAPGRYELPAGRHRLELKPFGSGPSRYVAITVHARDVTRVSVPVAAGSMPPR
jgi:serine/threonine-protein kinase